MFHSLLRNNCQKEIKTLRMIQLYYDFHDSIKSMACCIVYLYKTSVCPDCRLVYIERRHLVILPALAVSHTSIFLFLPENIPIAFATGWDVPMGVWGRHAPSVFKFARKLVKSQPCYKRVGYSIFWDLFS